MLAGNRLSVAFFLFWLGIIGFHFLYPERVPELNGLGWDGEEYAVNIRHFREVVYNQKLDTYRFQRIFPQAVVYASLRIRNIPFTDAAIVQHFLVLNVLLVTLSIFFWIKIAHVLQLSPGGRIVGFTGIFVNYVILKMTFYNPVLSDTTAFALGMAMLYFFISGKDAGLLMVTFLGAFTFPTLLIVGLLLFLFPFRRQPLTQQGNQRLIRLLAMAITIGFLLFVLLLRQLGHTYLINPMTPLVWVLSMVAVMVYLFVVARPLLYIQEYGQLFTKHLILKRALIGLALFIAAKAILWFFTHRGTPRLNYKGFMAHVALEAITNPFTFLVAHAVYFGPALFLLLYFWKNFIRVVNHGGLGLHGCILFYALLSIGSESRQFINAWPFFVTFLCLALEKYPFPRRFYIIFFLLSLAFSKLWLWLNRGIFTGKLLEFPDQWYFMSQGPWMSDQMYLVQGIISIICFIGLYFLFLKKIRPVHA
jgi:hypothetical protein